MARYSDQTTTLVDGLPVPLAGVSVYVYDRTGALATLTEDGGGALNNPVTSDSYGNFHFNAADGLYTLSFHYGGKEVNRIERAQVGTGPVLPADIVAALSQSSAATLIGSDDGASGALWGTVAGFISYLRGSLGGSLVSLISLGSGAVARSLLAWFRDQPLTPEAFGAVGDGTTNDAPAFALMLTAAQTNSLPIRLTQGKTYGLGVTGWVGLSVTMTGPLYIDGNGATLKLLVVPSQTGVAGSVNPFFKFDGTTAYFKLQIRNCVVDFNGIKEPCFAPYRCDVDFQGCRFTNGDISASGVSDASIAFYLNACRGLIQGNSCKNIGYFCFPGTTDANMHSDGLRIAGNRGEAFYKASTPTVRGDFVVGVLKNSSITGNDASGCTGAVSLAGYNVNSAFCSNVAITGNTFADCYTNCIQTDIVGAIYALNITITGNTLKNPGVAGAAVYCPNLRHSTIVGNDITGAEHGIFIDNATDITISGNECDGTGGATPRDGIHIGEDIGACSRIAIGPNTVTNFANGINIPGAPSFVSMSGGVYNSNSAVGVRVIDGTSLSIGGGLIARGNTTTDIVLTPLEIAIGSVSYGTATGMIYTFTGGDTTPSVKGGRKFFRANNSGATVITTFDDSVQGQEITVYCTNGNTTFNHGTLQNPGGANLTVATNMSIAYRNNGGTITMTGQSA